MSRVRRTLFAGGVVAGLLFGGDHHQVAALDGSGDRLVHFDIGTILRGAMPDRLTLAREEAARVRRQEAAGERVWPPRHLPLSGTMAIADAGFFVSLPGTRDEVALTWLLDPSGRRSYRTFAWQGQRARLRPAGIGTEPALAWTRAASLGSGVPTALLCDRADGLVLLMEGRERQADRLRATGAALGCERPVLLWRMTADGPLLVPGSAPAEAELVLTPVGLDASGHLR